MLRLFILSLLLVSQAQASVIKVHGPQIMLSDLIGQVKTDKEIGPKRFHGSVALNSTRVGRDAGQIADEVISHLVGLVGANVTVTLEIDAEIPSGAPENVVRTVTENSHTLKFASHGFEKE